MKSIKAYYLAVLAITIVMVAGSSRVEGQVRILDATSDSVEVSVLPPNDGTFVLETTAELMDRSEWEGVLQFRGRASVPQNWIDPYCTSKEAKFFRLRQILDGPPVEVSDFRLMTLDEGAESLHYNWHYKGVVIYLTGADIDHALGDAATLKSIENELGDKILTWVVSLSGPAERAELRAKIGEQLQGIPVLEDASHSVTRTLSSGKTPEVLLVDTSDWSMRYRGPAELTVRKGQQSMTMTPLRDAVNDLLGERLPTISSMKTGLGSRDVSEIAEADYVKDIAPMLIRHCFPCHTEGDIAPWVMKDHAVIAEFAPLIKSAVLSGEMPPWHADRKYGIFSNTKEMSNEEIGMLVDWIDRGSPFGESGMDDPLAVYEKPVDDGWPMGTPDAVVSIPRQSIPASGVVDYKYLQALNPFGKDVWLKGVAVKPGNREVVHHCLVFKGNLFELIEVGAGLGGFFAGYVPGMEQTFFPDGTGKLLKRSDLIVFQMHYTTSGKAASDVTQLGLYLADGKPEKELQTGSVYDIQFSIPPNARRYPVSATRRFDKPTTIYELSPHMHYRGASARFYLDYPDGKTETLLNVPAYFFDWQALYRLDQPKTVPAGTVIRCEGTFDNSIQNPYNPDPADRVRFGEQSWQEMFIGYINFAQ